MINEIDKAVIRGLRSSGRTLKDLATEFGVSKERIRQITLGIKVPHTKFRLKQVKISDLPENHKRCTQCLQIKHIDEFHKFHMGSYGRAGRCKNCAGKVMTDYYRKRTYNITTEEYDKLLLGQNNCCAICGKSKNEFKRGLSVDHDHETKKVRGLLCTSCNLILGNSYDNIEILESAIKYLTQNG